MSTIVLASREQWAKAITESWNALLDGLLETGERLISAKEGPTKLPFGEFEAMVNADLPFGPRQARMLMQIHQHPVLANRIYRSALPPALRTLEVLARIGPEFLTRELESGSVTPTTERSAALRIWERFKLTTLPAPEPVDTCTVEDLNILIRAGSRFRTIYVDPPWQYGNQSTRAATDRHYDTMSIEELHALPVASLADENAHLHLWTTNGFLREAIDLMPVWGFEFKSCFVWTKPSMGIGNYWRVSHEFLLFGLRGTLPFGSRSLMSWATLDRGRHSAKPEAVRQMVEQASPAPRLELFGRRPADGWTVWGNEIARSALGFDDDVPALVEENT